MIRRWMAGLIGGAVFLSVCAAVGADIIFLKNGGRLEGEVEEHDDYILLKTRHGTQRVDRDRIKAIRGAATPEQRLDEQRRAVEAKDPESWYAFATWCRTNGFSPEAEQAFSKVLELNENHPGARKALGFEDVGGQWVKGSWQSLEDGNVEYRYTTSRTDLARYQDRVRAFRESFLRYYKGRFDVQPFGDVVIVQLFDSEEEYRSFSVAEHGEKIKAARGYTDHQTNKIITYLEKGDLATELNTYTLFHELGHLLTYRHITRPKYGPHWFQEGWADYLGGASFRGGSVSFGDLDRHHPVVRMRARRVLDAAAHGSLVDFNDLIHLDQHEYPANDYGLFYAEAWSIVFYLHEADGGKHREAFDRFVKRVAKDGAKSSELFTQHFGSPEDFQASVLAFLRAEFRR